MLVICHKAGTDSLDQFSNTNQCNSEVVYIDVQHFQSCELVKTHVISLSTVILRTSRPYCDKLGFL